MRSTVFWGLILLGPAAFGQITLGQALDLARQKRPAVEAARLRIEQAKLSRRSLGSYPATRGFLGYSTEPEAGGTDDDAVISQPIDIFGRGRAGRATGDAQVLRAEAEARQTLLDIQNEVITLYSESAASAELAANASYLLDIAERLHSAIKKLVEEGNLPGLQLTRIGIELERAKITESQRGAELRANLQRLAAAIGADAEQLKISGFETTETPRAAELTVSRPDLLLLNSDIRAAEAEARVARLGNMPELEVQARRTPWQETEHLYGARIQLAFPIFDHGRTRAETRAATTKAEAAKKSLADATRIAKAEVEAAQIELVSAAEQIPRFEKIVDSARLLVERSRIGFTEGALTLMEILDATRALREVEESMVEARLRFALAQARYLRATGHLLSGGAQDNPKSATEAGK